MKTEIKQSQGSAMLHPLTAAVPLAYANQPRQLSPLEIAAIDAQCITDRYPQS